MNTNYSKKGDPMRKKLVITLFLLCTFACFTAAAASELEGVTFPEKITVNGKTLTLNGTALLKKFVFVKVYAGGFYLENPTKNGKEAIESEQIKVFDIHYLTDKATAEKLRHGFKEEIINANPEELVQKHKEQIDRFASWFDTDMKVGSTSKSVYIPGEGLTFYLNDVEKGTIKDKEFARMYYRYTLGEEANDTLREGYLGL